MSVPTNGVWRGCLPSGPPVVFQTIDRFSSLHQERAYLFAALANEERRAEQLTRSLQTVKSRLEKLDISNSTEGVPELKKSASSLTRKLRRCHKSEKAMVNNLAAVTARTQELESYQWRKAQHSYNQRMHCVNMNGLMSGMQGLSMYPPTSPYVLSPFNPTLENPWPHSPMTPMTPLTVQVPPTPVIWPQHPPTLDGRNQSITALTPTPTQIDYDQTPTKLTFEAPVFRLIQWTASKARKKLFEVSQPCPKMRTMSLPTSTRPSMHLSSPLQGIQENDEAATTVVDLPRRLSLVGGASAGLRILRKSKAGSS